MGASARICASLGATLALSGCETLSYYAQAIGGQLSLMSQVRPVAALIADPATPQALRERLALAQSIRDYAAKELKLPDNASYRGYADLGRPYAVWNVVAAAEFSLEPVRSCFPVAGCVAYRGFFARADAERHADAQRKLGRDVFVGGVPAYSTLGRFDDPLLSSFIRYADAELARLIFHELSHQVVYLKDDSTFNESFAVAVERAGLRRWLSATGRAPELKRLDATERRSAEFLALLAATRARLEALYRSGLPPDAMRDRKRGEFAALRARYEALKHTWGGHAGYDRFFAAEPNNALLAAFATYTGLVPAFERLLAESSGEFGTFYEAVRGLAALEPAERAKRLNALR